MINLERVYKINSTLGVESNKFKKEFKLIESFSTLNKLDIPGKNITVFYKNENNAVKYTLLKINMSQQNIIILWKKPQGVTPLNYLFI